MRYLLAVIIAMVSILLYPLVSLPYVVHSTVGFQGVVVKYKIVKIYNLSDGLKDVASIFGDECAVILLHDRATNTNATVISKAVDISQNDVVIVRDVVAEWMVTWQYWQLFNEPYDYIIVGILDKPASIDSWVVSLLQSKDGSTIYIISMFSFIILPIIISVIVYRLIKFKIWIIMYMLTTYSLGIFELNYFSNIHDIQVQTLQKILGYMFIIWLLLTLYLIYKENKENLIDKIKSIYKSIIKALADVMEGD